MGIRLSTMLPRLATAAFLLCCTLLLSASGSSADQAPMSAEVHLATPATFSQGEPIVLHYTVSNNSATKQLSFDAGPRHQGWYRLSITNAAGQKTIAAVPNPSLDDLAPQGLHQAPEISLLPNGTIEGDIVAAQTFAVARPGDYILTLRIPITYFLEPRGAWYPQGRPADQVPLSFSQDYNFHLKITKADSKRLSAAAETLRHELQDVKFAGQRKALLTALSVLPETAALPSWQSLVLDPATPSGVFKRRRRAARRAAFPWRGGSSGTGPL